MDSIAEIRFSFDSAVVDKLAKVSANYKLTPYIYSQCIFAILLHKYVGRQHFSIAYPVAIREGAQFIYGSQVNLNLITYDFEKASTVAHLLDQVSNFFATTTKNEIQTGYYPISDILQTNDNNGSLLRVLFTQAYFRDRSFSFHGIEKTEAVHTLGVDGATQNTLVFEHDPTRDRLNYRVKYDQRSISTELLHVLINSYKKLFIDVLEDLACDNHDKLIASYSLLTTEQYQQLAYNFNQTRQHCSRTETKTIHQLYEEQVTKTPNNIAIAYEDKELTYQELNQKANQLARHIHRKCSIHPDDLIALYLDKSEHTFIAILAVLKCGAAYVPIDPAYPPDRIKYVLEDTRAKAIISNEHYEAKLKNIAEHVPFISMDSNLLMTTISKEEKTNLATSLSSTNLAYVIYTSGTTGQPKGVPQQHDSIVSLFRVTESLCQFNAHDVWLVFHSYVFDVNVWEMWGALIYGGKLIIPTSRQLSDFEELYALCKKRGVTVINQTPSAFYLFSEVVLKDEVHHLHNLRYVILAGEKLNSMALSPWLTSRYGDTSQLVNMYGITELTVLSTHKIITKDDLNSHSCIGHILPGQTGYVLDANLCVLPIGAIGELHIGGERLARGYLNKPALTHQRFITNPFQTKEEESLGENLRLYKTGDLVRWLPDGSLEYICRNDTQLKIRGYRIESVEIETLLCGYPGIKQAIVLAVDYRDSLNAHLPTQNPNGTGPNPILTHNSPRLPALNSQAGQEHDIQQNQSGLLPIQQWFFAQQFENSHHWNQSFLIRTPQLDVDILTASLTRLINYHDAFSLRFSSKNGVVQPYYVDRELQCIEIHQLNIQSISYSEGTKEFNDKLYEILTSWQSKFDIVNGPLFSIGYLHGYKSGDARVYFALHHLIVDVVSWHIIAYDLQKIYALLAAHKSADPVEQRNRLHLLDHRHTSYERWVNAVQSYASKNVSERSYWLNVLAEHNQFDAQLTRLVNNRSELSESGGSKNRSNQTISFVINKNDTEMLLAKSRSPLQHKVNEILLAAFAMAIRELLNHLTLDSENDRDSIYVTLEGHGREETDASVDVSHTIGWFTTMFPCKLTFGDASPLEVLKLTQQTLHALPTNGLGYGALFGYTNALPRISFNYLGQLSNQDEITFWSITGESSGRTIDNKNKNTNVIDIVCCIINGQLELTLVSQLEQRLSYQLLEVFKLKLVTLTELINPYGESDLVGGAVIGTHPYSESLKEKTSQIRLSVQRSDPSGNTVQHSKRLVAYYASNVKLNQTDIRAHLSRQLPPYSVPQEFIWLSAMPLTVNGKVDTKALSRLRSVNEHKQTLPSTEKENLICEAFAKVLGRKQVGIDGDFFSNGGDSLSAITLVMHLQHYFDVSVRDIFNYRTPSLLAKNLPISKNNIKNKLLEIRHEYEHPSKTASDNEETIDENLTRYFSSVESLSPDISRKQIKNVLLTGATGYLGCNILNQLLNFSDYNVYLLVRAGSDQSALERVNHTYQSYFFSSLLDSGFNNRVVVLRGDLEKEGLGLSRDRYAGLASQIDSVIHSAALVKQIGDTHQFYKTNVQATINLLEFSKLSALKDFHYVSTTSVLKNSPDSVKQWGKYCTEEHLPGNLEPLDNNIYLRTKLEAESNVVNYRNQGVNTVIYRVGNLAFMLKNSSVQENIDTVGFTHWLRYLLQAKAIFLGAQIEISPVDLTAGAIVQLFDKKCSTNSVYHVFNNHQFDLVKYMQHHGQSAIRLLTVPAFIQHLINELEDTGNVDSITRFLLAHGWLGVDGFYQFSQNIHLQNKTLSVLNRLGFQWPIITSQQFKKYLNHAFEKIDGKSHR